MDPSTTCHWNGNRVSKLKYGPLFTMDHKSLLLPWVNPARLTIPLNTTLLVFPSSPVVLNLAETLPYQCVLNALAHSSCFNLPVMAHKGTKVGGSMNSRSGRSALRDTELYLAFGHREILEFLNGPMDLNYSFFYLCLWIFVLKFSRGNLMA